MKEYLEIEFQYLYSKKFMKPEEEWAPHDRDYGWEELKTSIKENGIKEPLRVKKCSKFHDKYEVINGNHRWKCLTDMKYKDDFKIQCVVIVPTNEPTDKSFTPTNLNDPVL